MADAKADAALQPEMQRLAAGLRARLWQLQAELSEQGVAEASSSAYCRGFCQTLLQCAGNRGAAEHILPLLEVYQIAIQSFASARPYLTTECEDVLLILGRLVLSCFELLLSVPDSEEECEPLLKLFQSVQDSHNALLEFGDGSLEVLAGISKEGVWKNPVLLKILSQQPVDTEEVNLLIKREGPDFLQMRIKHLMKTNCLPQAASLSKLCKESTEISDVSPFLQAYITCLCSMHPNEESFREIAKVDCKEVLDMICNLETEGQESTAFILCTTYLTQQLQTASVYCSWELTLFWSKLQRRIDPSLDSFLERCRQFGIIARTLQHLFFLIRVIQAEAEESGLAVSILLCVRALQLRSNENDDMKTSVCKTIACLLPEDLEVRRACQLTEYLLKPSEEGYSLLEELYMQPDQKFDEENAPVPNSLRCELLLALKAYWPFDPEFWDWKTLKRHCLKLLGKDVSESEEDLSCNETELLDSPLSDCEETREENNFDGINQPKRQVRVKKPIGSSERYQRWLQYKFFCLICKRECIEARILHHSKMHMEDGIFTCPVCIKKFKRKDVFVTHVMEHVKMPPSRKYRAKKKILIKKERLAKSSLSVRASTRLVEDQPLVVIPCKKPRIDTQDYVTFSKLENCHLQDRDLYPCPGTDCSRVFKQFKYLSVHLKAEHQNNDENAVHYLDMKNRREKCSYCRRHFVSAFHLQEHEQVHSGPQPFMCVSVGCYARFGSVNELLHHKQQHDDLRYKCELSGCNIVFSDLGQLYHHEAQHFRDASYTCNFHGCKKFYYSKTEFTNHLSVHISNGEMKEVPIKHEENVSSASLVCLSDSEVYEQKGLSHLHESLSLPSGSTNSEGIPDIKQEPLSDGEVDDKSNGSFQSNVASPANEKQVLTETVDHGEAVSAVLLPHEKVFLPSNLKERYSNVAVYFDGKRFTCGFEGCGSTYKNSKGIQKHLRRTHPYHFKLRRKLGLKTKEVNQLIESRHCSTTGEMYSELQRHPNTNAETLDIFDCNTNSKHKSYLKEDSWSSSPETSLFEHPKASSMEDAMFELLLGLKHLSLKNSSTRLGSSSRLLQSYPSKCPNSDDESTSDHFSEEQQGKLPNQYLTQLAAKPFFCERQGCTCEFVTREALLTHYVRKHNYSKEMVLQLNMFQYRYSPFKCHICQRSFTRKTHLRVHYRNKHKLGNVTATQKLFANESFEDMGDCAEDTVNSSVASVSSFYANTEEELDDQAKLTDEQLCHPKKDISSETDLESSEDAESCISGKQTKLSALESHRKGLEAQEGRGSKRTVAKGNLCYILHKYHKPFHCIHKNCNSAFTNQKGLIRHYRTVHQYNKEQLCLEKDKARSKRELTKCKKIFVCKHKACSKRFLCSKSLAKHCSDYHSLDHEDSKVLSETDAVRFPCRHPHCPAEFYSLHKLKRHLTEEHAKRGEMNKDIEIHCNRNGCNRVFTTYSRYAQHVYFRHSDYDGISGGAKEKGNHLKDDQEQSCLKNRCLRHEVTEKKRQTNEKVEKNNNKNKGKQLYNFRRKEEALQMCRDNCNQTQYPCMIQGCPSVVKLESSIVRHYKRTHQMPSAFIEQQYEGLVLCVECGTVISDSYLEANWGSNKEASQNFKQEVTVQSAYQHGREEHLVLNSDCDHDERGDKNGRCSVGDKAQEAGIFLCTGTLKHVHNFKTRCSEECSRVKSAQQCKVEAKDFSGSDGREDISNSSKSDVQFPKEKDANDQKHTSMISNTKKLPTLKEKVQKPFDLKSFKPMGFESSFLKFIQESEERGDDDDSDDDFEDKWEPSKQYEIGSMVKKDKDSKRELSQGKARYENVPVTPVPKRNSGSKTPEQLRGIQPLLSKVSSSIPSLENLRAILDKALTNCGDHALKQLHYLRPVVVLERSKFSTSLIDFFPTKKTDRLCVGSS